MYDVFVRLLNMSIAASWLVLAIIILRLIFRRASRVVHCLLWIAVVIRLVCPFFYESRLGVIPNNNPIKDTVLNEYEPVLHANISVELGENILEPYVEVVERNNVYYDLVHIGLVVWIIGMVVIVSYSLINYVRLRLKVRESVLYRYNIWRCDHVNTPFIIGFINPRIIIPSSMDEEAIPNVAAHEIAHLERKDNLWKPLATLLLVVYWMNPIMWIAYILFCRDIEFACDDKVIYGKTDEFVKEYMNTLVNCSVPKYKLITYSVAFGEISVKRRVKRIVGYKKPAIFMAELLALISVMLIVSFLVIPAENEINTKLSAKTKELLVTEPIEIPSVVANSYEGVVPNGEGGTEEITYEDLIDICMKGDEVRLDDFDDYKYELTDDKDMILPLADYKDVYVVINYDVDFDGNIGIYSVYLWYEPTQGDKALFSLSEQMRFYAFTQMEPRYDERKLYVDLVYGSVTNNSMIVEVCNDTDESYIWDFSYELYEINGENEVLIATDEGEQINYQSDYNYMHEIKLEDGVSLEEGKHYLLKYGRNRSGYIYSEIMFVK